QYFEDMNDLHPNEGWDRAFDQLRVEQRDGPYDVKHIQNFRPISRKVTPQVGITNKDRYFQGIKIRSNYDDVLTSEDPTIANPKAETKADLTGAAFSYTRDFRADSNSWSAVGAIIAPFVRSYETKPNSKGPLELKNLGVIPSISF